MCVLACVRVRALVCVLCVCARLCVFMCVLLPVVRDWLLVGLQHTPRHLEEFPSEGDLRNSAVTVTEAGRA